MSSRQEEKERRRREREEAERAAQHNAERRKRLGIVLGGLLVAAIAVIVALAVLTDDDADVVDRDGVAAGDVAIPPREETNINRAARAAGCELNEHEDEGREHTESDDVEYEANPPTSGPHHPVPAEDGVYAPDNPPNPGPSVHSLEHGRVLVQYRPGTPQRRVAQLEAMVNEEVRGSAGYKTLLFQNQTGMEHAVAATAWTRSLTCREFNDQVFDALRAFREQFVDKGPEFVP
jgi:hypothetical protein